MPTIDEWTGREARALRLALRLSVRDFANRLGIGARTVSNWEAGQTSIRPRPEMQAVLDTALSRASDDERSRFDRERGDVDTGTAVGSLALLDSDEPLPDDLALRVAQEWRAAEPPQLREMRAGRRIGVGLANAVRERADELRRLDDVIGGEALQDLVLRELQATVTTVREASYTASTGQQLLAALADLCQIAGWVSSDAGLHEQAERCYLAGVSAAHEANEPAVAANLLSCLAYQKSNVGDRREAVLLAQAAVKGLDGAQAPGARALMWDRVAWTNATVGDPAGTTRALGEAEEAFADHSMANAPEWLYWVTADELQVMAGRCHVVLRQPERAEPLLTAAIGRYDATHVRELALYESWLAETYVQAGEIEQAAATASNVADRAATVASERLAERVRDLVTVLAPYRALPAVREWEQHAEAHRLARHVR